MLAHNGGMTSANVLQLSPDHSYEHNYTNTKHVPYTILLSLLVVRLWRYVPMVVVVVVVVLAEFSGQSERVRVSVLCVHTYCHVHREEYTHDSIYFRPSLRGV